MEDPFHTWRTLFCCECGHNFRIPLPCKDRYCPVCNKIRLSKIRRKLTALAKMQQSASPGSIRFLTLTIKSSHNLPRMVRMLQVNFRKLRQTNAWKKRVTGGAYVIEFTRNDSGWHAHLHILIAGKFFPWATLRDLWQKISGNPGVYLKMVPDKSVVGYLTKYITKPDEKLGKDDIQEINNALFGTRLYQPFGQWHGWNINLKLEHPPCPNCESTRGYLMSWDIQYSKMILEVIEENRSNPPPVDQLSFPDFVPKYVDPF